MAFRSFWKDGQTPKVTRAKRRRAEGKLVSPVRRAVFEREASICRCCQVRGAASLHELRFRSLGGKRSLENSIATCGDGVRGCHGFLQRNEITYQKTTPAGADGRLVFTVTTPAAAKWLGQELGHSWPSDPRRVPFLPR